LAIQAVLHPEFRCVNTVLGKLKTAISGTYPAFNFAKYADRYLAEVQYRFNRRFDLSVILRRYSVPPLLLDLILSLRLECLRFVNNQENIRACLASIKKDSDEGEFEHLKGSL
jgi:hypothetical protein